MKTAEDCSITPILTLGESNPALSCGVGRVYYVTAHCTEDLSNNIQHHLSGRTGLKFAKL